MLGLLEKLFEVYFVLLLNFLLNITAENALHLILIRVVLRHSLRKEVARGHHFAVLDPVSKRVHELV